MKDLLDAINTRVKEPYWGFFLLSFLAFNWRALFLLCFTNGTAQARLDIFDLNTSFTNLFVYPILVALTITLLTPWLKVLFGRISRSAYEQLNSQELVREHKYLAEKNKLEKERAIELGNKEKELIEQAKRDEDIDKIEDEKLKESLKREIDQLRKNRNELVHNNSNFEHKILKSLSTYEKQLIKEINQSKDGCIQKKRVNGQNFVLLNGKQINESDNAPTYFRYVDSITSLVKKGLLKDLSSEGKLFELMPNFNNILEEQL
ncbi:hypothetical protein BS636_11960 [Acinetobacter sp. LoGeW2-3]|uniref:hypothetical protein n=1 Tax=Acinetobacter sp. LoGeW2-3 TaxID=1808001 RepID=UPI000C059E76|nr:hypothetical protein [Acinetobacter sp. LoGeW2-3]ATO20331.1 hypothetical protein BS636_11960 [Acinetobacter sp. LoGeW2-3]